MRPVRDDRRPVNIRLTLLRLFVGLGLLVLITSYWFLQIVHGEEYRRLSESNRLRTLPVHATRGVITDRDRRVMASNQPAFDLLVYRSEMTDWSSTREFLVQSLGLDPEDVDRRLLRAADQYDFVPVRLAEDIPLDLVARVSSHSLEHPELAIEVTEKRSYRDQPRSAHLIGHLGEASGDQIRDAGGRLRIGDLAGQSGIELAYDRQLSGSSGERTVVVDSLGREVLEASRRETTPGEPLHLTLDLELQKVVEDYLAGQVGAAVVLDPRDGQILAMASAPDFDPDTFVGRLSPHRWQELLDNPRHPLQNRALQNTYSPGSTFKMIMAWLALENGAVTPQDRWFCPGWATIYGHTYRCHRPGGHGWVNLEQALIQSCDVYFYQLGKMLGIEAIASAARRFGLGSPTGVDLGPERRGLVPDEAWSLRSRGHGWYAGETISVSIGQGPLLVTPLQMARATAALANGGVLVMPHLLRGRPSPPPSRIPISPSTRDLISRGLWGVVHDDDGTGRAARVAGLDVCGKTGTAQVVRQQTRTSNEELPWEQRDHAWFVGWAPRESPTAAFAIFIEHGGHGGEAAAPLARKIVETWLSGSTDLPDLEETTEPRPSRREDIDT